MDDLLLLPARAHAFQLDPRGVERLALSESPFGASAHARRAATHELASAHLYPNADSEPVRSALADLCGVAPENVVVGNGADELLLLIALAVGGAGVRAAVCARTFAGHPASLAVAGCEVEQLAIDERGPRLEALLEAASRNDVLYVCNPHNPTGTVLDATEVGTLVAHCREVGCALVLDEAYAEFADPVLFGSGLTHVARESARPVVVVRSLSKAYGLAGLRCGYAVGPASFMQLLARVAATLPYRVNRVVLAAATAAVADQEHLRSVVARTVQVREELGRSLREQGVHVPATQTNFLFVELGADCPSIVSTLLARDALLVRDLGGMGFAGWARVGVCRPELVPTLVEAIVAARQDARAAAQGVATW